MSTDLNDTQDNAMEKIDVRVPATLLEQIDEEYEERGYASRSAAIRDALRDWVNPEPALSDEVLAALETSRKQRDREDTVSATAVRDQLGLDDEE